MKAAYFSITPVVEEGFMGYELQIFADDAEEIKSVMLASRDDAMDYLEDNYPELL